MSPERFAFAVGIAVFAGGSLGLLLHRVLPKEHVTGGGKDMLGAVVGMVTLLSALVLGLLIWTAYGIYAGQNIAIQTLAAKALQLDLALSDYGPEANNVRAQVRQALGKTIDEIWGSNESEAAFVANNFAMALHNMRRTRLWQASILRPMHRKTRLPLRRRRSTRSANRACRCHSRWPIPFPFRSSSSSSHGRRFSFSPTG